MPASTNHDGLVLRVARDYAEMSRWAADYIEFELQERPNLLLCASAGGSPTGTYAALADRSRRKPSRYQNLRVLQIDEWGGLPINHPATCRAYLETHLVVPLALPRARFEGPKSDAASPPRECQRIRRWLDQNGPVDICVLGLGLNGHVALNEPAGELSPGVNISRLTHSSLRHGMLKSVSRKPRYGLTLGIRDILLSRKVLLLVSGTAKRKALQRLLEPSLSTQFPASFLWLHPQVTIICDRDALPKKPKHL
jgi:galactosamine-6-phosphate isomerase